MKKLFRVMSSAVLPVLLAGAAVFASPVYAQLGSQTSDLVFTPITPCRILDTRNGFPMGVNTTRGFNAWGSSFTNQGGSSTNCNILESADTTALVINFTVVTPETGGYITAYPASSGLNKPLAATVNFAAGAVVGNNATLKLEKSAGSSVDFRVFSTSTLHLVADVVGYYAKPKVTALECVDVLSFANTLLPNTGITFYSPPCSAGYTMTGGGCFQPVASTGTFSLYGMTLTGADHPTNPLAQMCGVYNGHPTGITNVQARGRCCRIPGR